MDISKEFGAVNRALLLATLCKKGLPAEMIKTHQKRTPGKKDWRRNIEEDMEGGKQYRSISMVIHKRDDLYNILG